MGRHPVGIAGCLIFDIAQLIKARTIVFHGQGLVGQAQGFVGLPVLQLIIVMAEVKILGRTVAGMAEILVLGIPYLKQPFHEGIILWHNGPKGETVDPASAAPLFQQGGPPCNGGGDGNVVLVIFLLKERPEPHQQKAGHGNALFLAEIQKAFGRLPLQMEIGDVGLHVVRGVGGCAQLFIPAGPAFLPELFRPIDICKDGFG